MPTLTDHLIVHEADEGDSRKRTRRSWGIALAIIAVIFAIPLALGAAAFLGLRAGGPDYVSFGQLESEPIYRELPPGSTVTDTDRSNRQDLQGGLPYRRVSKRFHSPLSRTEIVRWYLLRFPTRYGLIKGKAPAQPALVAVQDLPDTFEVEPGPPKISVSIGIEPGEGSRGANRGSEVTVAIEVI